MKLFEVKALLKPYLSILYFVLEGLLEEVEGVLLSVSFYHHVSGLLQVNL